MDVKALNVVALLALSLPVAGQVRITFTQEGAEVIKTVAGRRVKGIGVVAITAQNIGSTQRILRSQEIYAAAAHVGISYVSPVVADALIEKNAAKSKSQIALDLFGVASGVTGVLGVTKTIAMPNGAAAVLSLAPLVFPMIQRFVTSQLPSPNLVEDHLLSGSWELPPAGMVPDGLLMLIRFDGNWQPREVEVQ